MKQYIPRVEMAGVDQIHSHHQMAMAQMTNGVVTSKDDVIMCLQTRVYLLSTNMYIVI
jgi:hypothetical protein